jgi:hypothetical protein
MSTTTTKRPREDDNEEGPDAKRQRLIARLDADALATAKCNPGKFESYAKWYEFRDKCARDHEDCIFNILENEFEAPMDVITIIVNDQQHSFVDSKAALWNLDFRNQEMVKFITGNESFRKYFTGASSVSLFSIIFDRLKHAVNLKKECEMFAKYFGYDWTLYYAFVLNMDEHIAFACQKDALANEFYSITSTTAIADYEVYMVIENDQDVHVQRKVVIICEPIENVFAFYKVPVVFEHAQLLTVSVAMNAIMRKAWLQENRQPVEDNVAE